MGADASPQPSPIDRYRAEPPTRTRFEAPTGRRPILIVPGLDNSGPDHWQSHWQSVLPAAERVEQADWSTPSLAAWRANLLRAVARHPGALLVAHSLGCAVVAHAASELHGRVSGALLVAPADVDEAELAGGLLRSFAPMPRRRLPFPALVAASRNDPYVAFARAEAFASDWGAELVDLGAAGHVNAQSGHRQWREALTLLDRLAPGDGLVARSGAQ